MNAQAIMSAVVVTIDENATLEDVINLLDRHKISGVPVVNRENAVVGIISEKDIAAFSEQEKIIPFTRLAGFARQNPELREIAVLRKSMELLAQTPLQKVMTKDVITASEDTLIAEVAQIMKRHRVNRIPVVDSDNQLRGIVTRADVVKFLADKEQNLR